MIKRLECQALGVPVMIESVTDRCDKEIGVAGMRVPLGRANLPLALTWELLHILVRLVQAHHGHHSLAGREKERARG